MGTLEKITIKSWTIFNFIVLGMVITLILVTFCVQVSKVIVG